MEKIVRDTNADLMNHVLELVKESGNYEKAGKIMDYFLAESGRVKELTNYEFDFLAEVRESILIAGFKEVLKRITGMRDRQFPAEPLKPFMQIWRP